MSIIPFEFDGAAVRVVEQDGKPWFVAGDIASILGYAEAKDMTRNLDDDEKGRQIVPTLGGAQEMSTISESGLYSAILTSRKPEAKRFKKWVTSEVLPSIRRTGGYKGGQPVETAQSAAKLFAPFMRVARLIGCDKNAAAISANQAVMQVTGTNVLQLLGRTHLEAANQEALHFTPTELGKRLDPPATARAVNLLLAEAGFQMKRDEVWEVLDPGREFARILDTGKKHGSGVPIQQIKWAANVLDRVRANKEAA